MTGTTLAFSEDDLSASCLIWALKVIDGRWWEWNKNAPTFSTSKSMTRKTTLTKETTALLFEEVDRLMDVIGFASLVIGWGNESESVGFFSNLSEIKVWQYCKLQPQDHVKQLLHRSVIVQEEKNSRTFL